MVRCATCNGGLGARGQCLTRHGTMNGTMKGAKTSRPVATTPANNGHTNETAARLSRKAQAYLDAQRGYKAILAAGHPETSARAIEARNIMRGAYAALTGADLGAINRQKGKV
jgi:hypothetical protein